MNHAGAGKLSGEFSLLAGIEAASYFLRRGIWQFQGIDVFVFQFLFSHQQHHPLAAPERDMLHGKEKEILRDPTTSGYKRRP